VGISFAQPTTPVTKAANKENIRAIIIALLSSMLIFITISSFRVLPAIISDIHKNVNCKMAQ
jgi:hypothetical protein